VSKRYNRDPYIGLSEAQARANAEALGRRDLLPGITEAHRMSVSVNADYRRRQPETLRDAVRAVRQAYADEVPTKLHSGTELAEDGTPRMTPQATSIIFGNHQATDAGRPKCAPDCRFHPDNVFGDLSDGGRNHEPHCPAHPSNAPLVSYYLSPFRATLERMERDRAESVRKHAAIVSHVTIGSEEAEQAALTEGVPPWCSRLVAFDALQSFLNRLSSMKVDVAKEREAA
jgi:hypothetical protein